MLTPWLISSLDTLVQRDTIVISVFNEVSGEPFGNSPFFSRSLLEFRSRESDSGTTSILANTVISAVVRWLTVMFGNSLAVDKHFHCMSTKVSILVDTTASCHFSHRGMLNIRRISG